ncbi:hypothetical protein [Micromonospora sp. NPDC048063]|uniref:hypothetical protein n=1 Tax=Micromonospora sp. NPDC048063 TaxID=3364256 RepID=UPI0037115840
MNRPFARTIAAELVKLRSLPALLATVLGTVATGIALAAALASSAPTTGDTMQITTQTIVFLQVGPVLIGILTAATEYMGRQIVTTLTATPNRFLLLAGKAAGYLTAAATTSLATIGASAATAWITLSARGIRSTRDFDLWPLLGAVVYLVLIGLLALTVTVLLRSLTPPLVTMLALVLIVSPLLAGYTEHARWLPDKAGSLLYLPDNDLLLTPGTGALVLLAWITATAIAASIAFQRRDA